MAANRELLNNLMSEYVVVDNMNFWDEKVCKHFLVDFCPNLLFTNTKAQIDPCYKEHNERLAKNYRTSPDKHKYPYERDFYKYLDHLLQSLERKKQGTRRGDGNKSEDLAEERKERMAMLEVEIQKCLKESEEAGEEARVKEAEEASERARQLEKELEEIKNNKYYVSRDSAKKPLEICDCGAQLVVSDKGANAAETDRLETHYVGKQHTGYEKIRKALEKWKENHGNDYPQPRYGYRDQRDGGRERNYHRQSRRDQGYREKDESRRRSRDDEPRRHSRDSRDRRGDGDDWGRDSERYGRDRRGDSGHVPKRSRH